MRSFVKNGLAALVLALAGCGSSTEASLTLLPEDVSQTDSSVPCTLKKFFPDEDGDGFGSKAAPIQACDPPVGYVFVPSIAELDCRDNDAKIHPHACEIPANSIDDNCNNVIDEKDDMQIVTLCPPYDIVFVIDDSGSMLTSDPANIRYSGLKMIQLDGEDRATIISFSTDAHLLGELTTNQGTFQTYIKEAQSIFHSGGTDILKALDLAITQFDSKSSHKKAVILLTDGYNGDTGPLSFEGVHNRPIGKEVEMYALGLQMSESFLKKMVSEIGMFFTVQTSLDIQEIYKNIFSSLQFASWLECSSETETVQKFGDCAVSKSCIGLEGKLLHRDKDGDALGDPNKTIIACTPVEGYIDFGGDTDDTSYSVLPEKKVGEIVWRADFPCNNLALGKNNTLLVSYYKTNMINTKFGMFLSGIEESGRPVISSDGTVYFSQGKIISAYDAFGGEKWKKELSAKIITNADVQKEGSLYIGTTDGLQKVSFTGDGEEVYSMKLFVSDIIFGSGTVYLTSENGLNAFNTFQKDISWTNNLGSPAALGKDGNVYAVQSGLLFAINSVGKYVWQFMPEEGGKNIRDIVVDAKGVVYVTDDFSIHALYSTGTKKWETPRRTSEPPVVTESVLYASGTGVENGLYALATENGKHLWILKSDPETNEALQPKELIVDNDGIIFFCDKTTHAVYAVKGDSLPEEKPVWPMKFHDPQNTSNGD